MRVDSRLIAMLVSTMFMAFSLFPIFCHGNLSSGLTYSYPIDLSGRIQFRI